MSYSRTILMLAVAASPLVAASAADVARDPRPLTADEQKLFFPLVCEKPVHGKKSVDCAKLYAHPGPMPASFSLSLTAVTYPDPDRAYVSYAGDFEPHVYGFGGGILFERRGGRWTLVSWHRGDPMEHCVALPAGPHLLCLSGYAGQGETDSSVWLLDIPPGPGKKGRTAVLKAQDARESLNPGYQCTLKRGAREAILLSIEDLKRSKQPGILAEAKVSYAAPGDVGSTCKDNDFAQVSETSGIVRFKLAGDRVVALTPVPFALTGY